MDYSVLTQLISSVGFPICMCGALFWYMIKQNEQHTSETNSMKEAINSLEKAIIQLCDKIGGHEHDI